MKHQLTDYGFRYGPSEVIRVCSGEKFGVVLLVCGKHEEVEIRVTPGGYIRSSGRRKRSGIPSGESVGPAIYF